MAARRLQCQPRRGGEGLFAVPPPGRPRDPASPTVALACCGPRSCFHQNGSLQTRGTHEQIELCATLRRGHSEARRPVRRGLPLAPLCCGRLHSAMVWCEHCRGAVLAQGWRAIDGGTMKASSKGWNASAHASIKALCKAVRAPGPGRCAAAAVLRAPAACA